MRWDGSWDRWDLTLSDVESPGSQTAGRSTLFGCAWNDGRYEMEGGQDGAVCSASDATPDIVLSSTDLATTYLGTARFTTLSHAGRVEERTQGALLRADAMFATELAPWCPYGF